MAKNCTLCGEDLYLFSGGKLYTLFYHSQQGAHVSFDVFIGFFMSTIASVCIAIVMLVGGVFKKEISYLGIIGYTILLVYIVLLTFIPSLQEIAVMTAAPEGIVALIWFLLVGTNLIKMGKTVNNDWYMQELIAPFSNFLRVSSVLFHEGPSK